MPNTYTQVYIQIVFAVSGRRSLIKEHNREELQKYITGVISNRDQKPLAIYCMPNHSHILVGLKPTIALSDLVRDIKSGSSGFINDKKWQQEKFNWQEGFGAFSYSHSQLDKVISYINNQKHHHKKTTFKEEYKSFLDKFKISYKDAYLFDDVE